MVNPAVSSRNKPPTPSRLTAIPRAAPAPAPKARPAVAVAGPSKAPPTTKPPSITKPPSSTKAASSTKPAHDHDETINRLKKQLSTTTSALESERSAHESYTREVEALQSAHRLQFARISEQLHTCNLEQTEARLEMQRVLQGRLRRDFAIAQFQRKESELDALLDEAEEKDEAFGVWREAAEGRERAWEEEGKELRRVAKEAEKARTDAMVSCLCLWMNMESVYRHVDAIVAFAQWYSHACIRINLVAGTKTRLVHPSYIFTYS